MKERNKGWRNRIQFLKFKRRLRKLANCSVHFGVKQKVTTADLIRENAYVGFRTTSTPCSCMCCSGEHYKRHLQKLENERLLKEYNEERNDNS